MLNSEAQYEEGIESYAQIVAQGDDELVQMGFPPAQHPVAKDGSMLERPQMPTSVSSLTLAQISDHMSVLTGWYSYALEVLPTVLSERNAAESARDFAWSKIRKSHEGTVADKDDETRCDARYIEANTRYETCEYKYRRIKAICDGLLREIETLSRAMNSKEQDTRATGMGLNAARKAYGQGQGPMTKGHPGNLFRTKPVGRPLSPPPKSSPPSDYGDD